jgi:small subunit ribosomal protein S4
MPGMHGPRLRRKSTDYGIGLNEKQKARYLYGLTDGQIQLVFARAKHAKGVTGEVFLQMLEMRLDSIICMSGFAKTRRAARQAVNHGHVCVNGHKVDIASYLCRAGDCICVRQNDRSKHFAMRNLEDTRYRTVPAWLQVDSTALTCTVLRAPIRDEISHNIDERVIVEFYSR